MPCVAPYVAPRVAPHVAVAPPAFRPPAVVRPAVPLRIAPPVVTRPERPLVAPQRVITGRPAVGNHFVAVNRGTLAARGVYIHRPNGFYRPGYAYYHDRYAGWHHGYWSGWYGRPWLWFGAGAAAGWLLAPGENVVYSNPYYLAPPQQLVPVFDYSQPIPVPAPVAIDQGDSDAPAVVDQSPPPQPLDSQAPPPEAPDGASDESAAAAAKLLDDARQAFAANDYPRAQQLVDQAIQQQPKDTTPHEFRALTLFAQGKYAEAAATIYAVLAVGPGWDWDTLKALYPNTMTYTNQLRALEQYTKANPKDAAARFLLAYQYLVTDSRDAAVRTLQSVVALQPNDQLAKYLLQMLDKGWPDRPAPGT